MNSFVTDYLKNKIEVASFAIVEILSVGNVDGICIVAMSSNYDPEELDFYIEETLGYFEAWLRKLSIKHF
jgi:hypothetical protein